MLLYRQNGLSIIQHVEYKHSSNKKYRLQGIENVIDCAVRILQLLLVQKYVKLTFRKCAIMIKQECMEGKQRNYTVKNQNFKT